MPRVGINLVDLLGMHYWGSDKFHLHQLVTHMFLHSPSSFSHLFSNMFGLFMFGGLLERVWGARRFIIYYLVGWVGAGIIQQLSWWLTMTPEMYLSPRLPASGGCQWCHLCHFAGIWYDLPQYACVYNVYTIPIKSQVAGNRVWYFELMAGLSGRPDGIAHFAHRRYALGYILIRYWRKRARQNNDWQDFYFNPLHQRAELCFLPCSLCYFMPEQWGRQLVLGEVAEAPWSVLTYGLVHFELAHLVPALLLCFIMALMGRAEQWWGRCGSALW